MTTIRCAFTYTWPSPCSQLLVREKCMKRFHFLEIAVLRHLAKVIIPGHLGFLLHHVGLSKRKISGLHGAFRTLPPESSSGSRGNQACSLLLLRCRIISCSGIIVTIFGSISVTRTSAHTQPHICAYVCVYIFAYVYI